MLLFHVLSAHQRQYNCENDEKTQENARDPKDVNAIN